MWTNFEIVWNGNAYQCEAKVYDKPSHFGINDGRISKLSVCLDGEEIWSYDRGGGDDIPPGFIEKLMELYPETVEEVRS